ncbi:MAG TPA: CRTAC1 family protein, partial [Verrucomicrobiae bacterium]|nr:CRTAC1 family protein [Verrucomicrobiae bacterium]
MNFGFCLLALLIALSLPNTWSASEVTWKQGADFRSRSLQPDSGHPAGFTRLDPGATGILFTNVLQGDAFLTNAVAHNGSGVAVGDIDGDGWPDIYLCNLEGPNRLYRNLGRWRFAEFDLGEAACARQFSTGAAFADVNGDGKLDLLVNGIAAGTRLFLNEGGGKFQEALDSGLSRTASPTSLALADIDGDGDLDLYCTHYIDVMLLADPTTQFAIGRREGRFYVAKVNDQSATSGRWKDRFQALDDGSVRELPEIDGFYRNDGKGRFTAIQSEPGVFLDENNQPIPPFRDWGLAVMFRDVNGDGAPDLYVCNDNVSPDRFWINTGKGAFRAIDSVALRHTSRSSMGIDFADLDRDGHDDFIVLDMLARQHSKRMTQLVKTREELTVRESSKARPQFNRNTLFFGRADGTFAEAALMAGVAATDWSWCPVFLDVDLDGYEDLLVTNGFEQDVLDKDADQQFRSARLSAKELKRFRQMFPSFRTANGAFRNRGDGAFEPMGDRWGFAEVGVSYGMALGDLDNDGDLDIVVNNLNAPVSVYRNDSGAARIAVTLKGLAPNTAGIGARIKLISGSFTQSQEMISGGRYMSSDEPIRTFASQTNLAGPLRLEVRWRNGDLSVITNAEPNHLYEIQQPAKGQPVVAEQSRPAVAPNFADVSGMIGHVYTEAPFDDWARQPLLPHRLSRLGPGVAW